MKGGLQLRKDNCFDITFSAIYVSQQFWQDTDIGNAQIPKAQIPAYKLFDLTGDWYLTRYLRLIAGITNLTDEKYYDRVFANGIEPRRGTPVTEVCRGHFNRDRRWLGAVHCAWWFVLFGNVSTIRFSAVPVAQLDRASDFGSEGWGFESLQARHSARGTYADFHAVKKKAVCHWLATFRAKAFGTIFRQ